MLIVRVMALGGVGFEYVTDMPLEKLQSAFFDNDSEWIHIPGYTETREPVSQSVLRSQIVSVIIFPRSDSKIAIARPSLVQ